MDIVEMKMEAAGQAALLALKEQTPVDTGHAQDSWDLIFWPDGTKSKMVISNDAHYIEYLNEGHGEDNQPYWIQQTLLQMGLM